MTENKERLGLMAVALLAGLCLGGWLGRRSNHFCEGAKKVTVDTVVVWDTLKWVEPMPTDSVVTGVVRVPIVIPSEPNLPSDTVLVYEPRKLDSILGGQNMGKFGVSDTVWAVVPRTQKRYEDSTYTAWVSGYEPRLDSINVYRERLFVTKTQTVTKRNRFNVGLTGGVGYGILTRKPDVWIGIGVTWRPLP